jgi:hypothetical protein
LRYLGIFTDARSHEPSALLHQQRITQLLAQAPECVARGRGRDRQVRRGTTDMRLFQQGVEHLGLIEIESRHLHGCLELRKANLKVHEVGPKLVS